MTIDLDKLEAAAKAATPGPYRIVVDKFDTYHKGYQHTQRRIFTQWDHPQLKGPIGVVNTSYGIGEKEGDPFRQMVSIDDADADYIAAVSPDVVLDLIRRLRDAEADAKRLDYVLNNGLPMCRDGKYRVHGVITHWANSDREAIDAAIATQGASHD